MNTYTVHTHSTVFEINADRVKVTGDDYFLITSADKIVAVFPRAVVTALIKKESEK